MFDPSFLVGQVLSGLTAAMFLFIVASGLSLVFGVLRVLNFAHGSFYMLGAYLAWQMMQWLGAGDRQLLARRARRGAAGVALLGGVIERLLLRHLYGREDLYQLLLTYALVLMLGDAARMLWGTQQLSDAAARRADRQLRAGSARWCRTTTSSSSCSGPLIAIGCWLLLSRTGIGRMIRAAALDREMLAALGADVGPALHADVHGAARSSPGSAARWSRRCAASCPGMDVEIIVEAFIVVVIGGLGSFWGTFLGAIIFGQVLAFGILVLPGFSIFAVFALMALVLIVRPAGLFGRPLA